jgi:hypothetical protein
MDKDNVRDKIDEIIHAFIKASRNELQARTSAWKVDLSRHEIHEVVGGLVARQVTLANQLAASPGIWNGAIASLVLRTMADTHLTLAWILGSMEERARQYILYGLGQEKLLVEHQKESLRADGKDEKENPAIKAREAWINSQKFTFLTEVNVGSWSELDTRKIAEATNNLDLYRFCYQPFSSSTHSMWQHVSRYNLQQCETPLHKYHYIPVDRDFTPDIEYLHMAAAQLKQTIDLFDVKTGVKVETESSLTALENAIAKFGVEMKAKYGDDFGEAPLPKSE